MLTQYTETTIEPPTGPYNRRVEYVIPRANGSYDRSKHSKRPPRHDRLATDDKSYATEYLASASSVFFRKIQTGPRAFFWRVIAGERVVEIANVDFSRNRDENDSAAAVIALEFQDNISPRGVTICDSSSSETIHVFVLTKENEVFEIRLQPEWFAKPSSIPTDVSKWCGPVRASALSIDKAFQIHAQNPQDLFVSFSSGKVQHWKRSGIDDHWTYVLYDDRSWGASLFSIVSRKAHPDVEYEGMKLAYNTAHALTRHGQYLFTLCLNHTLRIWHLQTGKLVASRDLLDQARAPTELLQLKPAEPGYLQIIEEGGDGCCVLMSHSPLNGGQVKFWNVKNVFDDDTSTFELEDKAPSLKLALPDPDPTGTTIWMLAGLKVVRQHSGTLNLWVLWRNNNYHRSYMLEFQLGDLPKTWHTDWAMVHSAPRKVIPRDSVALDHLEIISTWMAFLFHPHRYSIAVLETALAQYSNALAVKLSANSRKRSLRMRLQETISAQVKERKLDNGALDHDRFLLDTDKQWRQFWRVVEALNDLRYAPLSLTADAVSGMVITPMTDSCCVIRESNTLELYQTNLSTDVPPLIKKVLKSTSQKRSPPKEQEVTSAIIILKAAKDFYDSFSPDLYSDFLDGLQDDLKLDGLNENPAQRVVDFFNEIDMANAITDEAEKRLHQELAPTGAKNVLNNKHFDFLFSHLFDKHARHHKGTTTKTKFGTDLTFATLLETVSNIRDVLLSLLAMILFVDDTNDFQPAAHYNQLIKLLKVQERNLWLATHTRSNSKNHSETVLQDIYSAAIRPVEDSPLYQGLTLHVQDHLDLISGDSAFKPEDNAVYLQCWLIKHGELDLAKQFLKFQPDTKWSNYIKGRLQLVLGHIDDAYKKFEDACEELSSSSKVLGKLEHFSNNLLTADEASHFYSGKPLYLSHIADLFEKVEAYNEVSRVAVAAIDALKSPNEPKLNFKQGLLLRVFKANLYTVHFDMSYEALVLFTDRVLQRVSTTELIDTMLEKRETLGGTSAAVKAIQAFDLSSHPQIMATIDSHIASLAKKQAANPAPWVANTNVDYITILHTLRLARNDYRGAMTTLFDRVRAVQKSGRARSDPKAAALRHALLALINIMTCVSDDEAYIIADVSEDPRGAGSTQKRLRSTGEQEPQEHPRKRAKVIITLSDLRREYQNVLDRCSRIERGDFDFAVNGEDLEEDEEDDGTWEGTRLNIREHRTSGAIFGNGTNDTMQID